MNNYNPKPNPTPNPNYNIIINRYDICIKNTRKMIESVKNFIQNLNSCLPKTDKDDSTEVVPNFLKEFNNDISNFKEEDKIQKIYNYISKLEGQIINEKIINVTNIFFLRNTALKFQTALTIYIETLESNLNKFRNCFYQVTSPNISQGQNNSGKGSKSASLSAIFI
jgi:hypothetical protein